MKKILRSSIIRYILHVITNNIFIFVSFQCIWVTLTLIWVLWFAPNIGQVLVPMDPDATPSNITDNQQILENGLTWNNFDDYIANNKDDRSSPTNNPNPSFNSQNHSMKNLYRRIIKPNDVLLNLIIGLILLGTLLFGAIWLFWSGQKRAAYYRQQQAFISSVTHELRTPITTLNLIFENLKNRQLDNHKYTNLLEIGNQELMRLMHLINNILLTARLDRGIEMLDEKKQKVTVINLLKKAIERNRALDGNLDNRISIKCFSTLSISAPRSALVTMFSNLIENAIKYSPKESPIMINVSFYAGDFVDIAFIDQGFGISDTDLKKIFKMFYRGDASNEYGINGTGVGLFIVKTITKLLRGQVWAESNGLNQGSKFIIRLPIK